MKHKSLSQMNQERNQEYQGGKAYRVMLDMFRKNKKEEDKNIGACYGLCEPVKESISLCHVQKQMPVETASSHICWVHMYV